MGHLIDRYRVGVRRACHVVKQSRAAWYYKPREKDDGPLLRRIEEIAATRVRYGFWRIFVLLRREGWTDNHKRVSLRLGWGAGSESNPDIRPTPDKSTKSLLAKMLAPQQKRLFHGS